MPVWIEKNRVPKFLVHQVFLPLVCFLLLQFPDCGPPVPHPFKRKESGRVWRDPQKSPNWPSPTGAPANTRPMFILFISVCISLWPSQRMYDEPLFHQKKTPFATPRPTFLAANGYSGHPATCFFQCSTAPRVHCGPHRLSLRGSLKRSMSSPFPVTLSCFS